MEEKIEKNNEKKAGTNAGKSGKKNRGLLIVAPLAGIMVILICVLGICFRTQIGQGVDRLFNKEGGDAVNTALLYNPQTSSYDEAAEERRQEILNTPDTVKPSETGKTYYVSWQGNDENDGLTQETAWRSSARVDAALGQLKEGDVVLFERDGIYRGSITLASGVTYGAYGSGQKPRIYGSLRNYAEAELWTASETEHVWELAVGDMNDVGNIVFDHGVECGVKQMDSELDKDFHFYHDAENGMLYLYLSTGNPGEVYEDIEVCSCENVLNGERGLHDVFLENLCIRYGGAHGIGLRDGTENVTVQGCEIGYVGGSILAGYSELVRYGNGFEVVDNCKNITVKDNWVYQCYDAGLTHQSSANNGVMQENITFSNNLVEYCIYNIEYYVNQEEGQIKNTVYENNILRFAGYGFGSVNRIGSDNSMIANICCYVRTMPSSGFVIRGNVLDSPMRYQTTIGSPNEEGLGPVIEGNTYIQRGSEVAIVTVERTGTRLRETLRATDQASLEESIARIDAAPASVMYE